MTGAQKYEALVSRLREWREELREELTEVDGLALSYYAQGRSDQVGHILSFIDGLEGVETPC